MNFFTLADKLTPHSEEWYTGWGFQEKKKQTKTLHLSFIYARKLAQHFCIYIIIYIIKNKY